MGYRDDEGICRADILHGAEEGVASASVGRGASPYARHACSLKWQLKLWIVWYERRWTRGGGEGGSRKLGERDTLGKSLVLMLTELLEVGGLHVPRVMVRISHPTLFSRQARCRVRGNTSLLVVGVVGGDKALSSTSRKIDDEGRHHKP